MTFILNREMAVKSLEDIGLSDEELYDGYSGRFMFGEKCFGIVCMNAGDIAGFAAALVINGVEEVEWLREGRLDQLGLRMIAYFPGVKLSE